MTKLKHLPSGVEVSFYKSEVRRLLEATWILTPIVNALEPDNEIALGVRSAVNEITDLVQQWAPKAVAELVEEQREKYGCELPTMRPLVGAEAAMVPNLQYDALEPDDAVPPIPEMLTKYCVHGEPAEECDACMVASDQAYDAAREDRLL